MLKNYPYDKYHKNYDRIGQIFQANRWNGEMTSQEAVAIPLSAELSSNYSDNFDYVVLSSWTENHVLSYDKQIIKQAGIFMDIDAPKLFSLNIVQGSINRERLVTMEMSTQDFNGKFDVLRSTLKEKGAIEELSESSSLLTSVNSRMSGYEW